MYPTEKRFLIPKNTSILVDKDLWQEDLIFTLVYSKNQGSKVEKADKNGQPRLTILEKNTKSKEIYFDYSKYNGGDYVFIDNQIQAGKPEQELDKYVFHPDNPSIKKLLAKNHLQRQNRRYEFEFSVFYLERDIEKYDPNTRTYYLNNEAQVKNAVQQGQPNKYSYQDCWNYALALREDINIQEICHNLSRYLKESYPVPYLTNQVSFYGLDFLIEKGVPLRVLEIGVGCGNITISLAKSKPKWSFTAIDINSQALAVAEKNSLLQQTKNIKFIQSNLFSNLSQEEKFSIIISNPPYVSSQEYQNLSLAVKAQPIEALLAENDGYFFYQQIFQPARNFLSKKFLLVVEIGHQQVEKVIKLIIEYFPQVEVSIYPDYAYMVTKKSTKKPVTSIVGKAKLAERIYNNKGRILSLNKLQIEAVISEVLEETKKSLLKGETIRFPSYYSLHTVMQKPRVAMNLQTKKKMTIPAKQLNGRAIAFQAIDRGSTPLIRSK
ncbi:12694_t:CDS:2 [Funneliformis geosporum]|nr:12694_t:CDS:2 [Funneliformis geosporum]